jgi:hypothetical protein
MPPPRLFTINNQTKSISQWASHYGICMSSIYKRIKKGWSLEAAITTAESHVKRDIIGKVFGKLTVVAYFDPDWQCRCQCNTMILIPRRYLTRKDNPTRSCGCDFDRAEVMRKVATTHGKYNTKAHKIWCGMRGRCKRQGSYTQRRGIAVCDRWELFENFYADMGDPPKGHTLDRIDTYGDYTPENCRWATMEQQQNNRTNNRLIELNGEVRTLAEWCKIYSIYQNTVYDRVLKGWEIKDALTTPTYRKNKFQRINYDIRN